MIFLNYRLSHGSIHHFLSNRVDGHISAPGRRDVRLAGHFLQQNPVSYDHVLRLAELGVHSLGLIELWRDFGPRRRVCRRGHRSVSGEFENTLQPAVGPGRLVDFHLHAVVTFFHNLQGCDFRYGLRADGDVFGLLQDLLEAESGRGLFGILVGVGGRALVQLWDVGGADVSGEHRAIYAHLFERFLRGDFRLGRAGCRVGGCAFGIGGRAAEIGRTAEEIRGAATEFRDYGFEVYGSAAEFRSRFDRFLIFRFVAVD